MRWKGSVTIVAILGAIVAPTFFPELLAFPYHVRLQGSEVWSERPIPAAQLDKVLERSSKLVAASPLAQHDESRRIFLTQGGWRWIWLAIRNQGAFAVTRAARETVVVNHHDVVSDRVWNGQPVGGVRSLSGVIAHETCHGMLRRHFGIEVDMSEPAWLREGYCDHVAQESSLTDHDAIALRSKRQNHPALIYWSGRKWVEHELKANGGSVDALFAAHRG